MVRLFVALEIEKGLRDKILDVQAQFAGYGQINFVERENFHLTLKFLGEIEDGRNGFPNNLDENPFPPPHNSVKEISERIKSVAEKIEPFKISISGLSFFGPPNHVSVIFLGVSGGREKVIEIEKALNEKLKDFRRDEFDPHPHITIARVGSVKDKKGLLDKIDSLKDIFIGESEVKEIFLMKSELKGMKAASPLSSNRGTVYSVVERFQLKKSKTTDQ